MKRWAIHILILLLIVAPVAAQSIVFSGVPPDAVVECLGDVPNGLIKVVGACPVAISNSVSPGDVITIHLFDNAIALALGSSGATQYKDNIVDGYSGMLLVGNEVNISAGNYTGPTFQGFQERLSSNRIIILPVASFSPGISHVTIQGFTVAAIQGFDGPYPQLRILSAVASVPTVTAGSGCGGMLNIVFGESQAHPTIDCANVITRTWSATNSCGSSATATQIIVIADTTLPSITCPAPVTVNTAAGQCTASNVSLTPPVTSDNCYGKVIVANNAPAVFAQGINTVIWSATDSCGNSNTCTQSVIVRDNQPPVISLAGNILTNTTDPAGLLVTFTLTATDNCDSSPIVDCTPMSGTTFAVGTTPVTCTSTDAAGNVATRSFNVTVMDDSSFRILSISQQNNNLLLTWTMPQGYTGFVQSASLPGNAFGNASPAVFIPGASFATTNYLDLGATTNVPARYYRIRLVP